MSSGNRRLPKTVRYKRSEHLVAYWDEAGLRICNFATGEDVSVSDRAGEALSLFSTWRTVEDAVTRADSLSVNELLELSTSLHCAGLLRVKGQALSPADRAMGDLKAWNPAVGFFHAATRNVPFVSVEEARLNRSPGRQPWDPILAVPALTDHALPPPRAGSPLSRVLLGRRSWRRFSKGFLAKQDLSTLLWLTGGVQKWAKTPAGEFAFKTSPSGGALHPTEMYVLARYVRGLAPGFYHYRAANHQLGLLKRHRQPASVQRYLPVQPWFEPAAAIVFLVAHYKRSLWRYEYARAYRAPFVEAGHLAQTFCLTATELNLAPFVSMALADRNIEREIGANGTSCSVLYAAGVGLRPKAGMAASSPEGMEPVKVTTNRIGSAREKRQ